MRKSVLGLLLLVGTSGAAAVVLTTPGAAEPVGLDGTWFLVETEADDETITAADPGSIVSVDFDVALNSMRCQIESEAAPHSEVVYDNVTAYTELPNGNIRFDNGTNTLELQVAISGNDLTLTRVSFTGPLSTPKPAPYDASGSAPPTGSAQAVPRFSRYRR